MDELFSRLEQEAEGYDYFEFWLDGIADLNEEHLRHLAEKYAERAIFLLRRLPGQTLALSEDFYPRVIEIAKAYNCLLDCDIRTQTKLLSLIEASSLKPRLLLSYHDYHACPGREELERILFTDMQAHTPEISKISCFCQTPEDAQKILCLASKAKSEGIKVICLGMGEHGVLTRVFGTLWYNEMVFAPVNKQHCSAPGQLSKSELEEIFSVFHKEGEVHGRRK